MQATGSGDVSQLNFITFDESKPFTVCGLTIQPLEVFHGSSYTCLGFKIGGLVYLSDVSHIPPQVEKLIENCDILILDSVELTGSHASHFTLPSSLAAIRRLKPKQAYLIGMRLSVFYFYLYSGMTHQFDHETVNAKLAKEKGINVQLSFDGMCLKLPL